MERTIDACTTVHAALGRVRTVLIDDPGIALTGHRAPDACRTREYATRLSVDLGGGTYLSQEVLVHAGLPHADADTWRLPLSWRASGHTRLFPTFSGTLELRPDRQGTRLELRGEYSVPFGVAGRFGDGVAGRRLAGGSVSVFLTELAARLDREVVYRLDSQPYRHESYRSRCTSMTALNTSSAEQSR